MLAEPAAGTWQVRYRERVEGVLERRLPAADSEPVRLHRAMRYAALGQGKRIRPLLVYATGAAIGVAPEALDAPAAAVELIHAYSLVHDDLPAMDDDDLRRGRPTTHRAFDEATAILAGDALQVLAFEILAEDPMPSVSDAGRIDMIRLLARASGTGGMAGGQAMDLAATGRRLEAPQIEAMHARKTGALIRASVLFACAAAPALPAAQRDSTRSLWPGHRLVVPDRRRPAGRARRPPGHGQGRGIGCIARQADLSGDRGCRRRARARQ